MNDPYQVLNIPSTASDEEVKKAYRELARKYHPDNYHDNPLADLAQEKMKEINEAYEEIQKRRKTGGGASYSSAQSQHGGGYSTDSADPTMRAVRQALSRNETSAAERILAGCSNHNAEWNFLMGVVCSRRGLMDQARRYLQTAYSMEPGNSEYRQAVENMTQHYTPEGFHVMSTGSGNLLPWCLGLACCSTLGGYGCIPCFC